MDWRLANSNYITATNGVSAIGRSLGQFLAFLNQLTGTSIPQMHLVGLGLGAHTIGFAGRELEGNVGRLSGKHFVLFFHFCVIQPTNQIYFL